MSQKVSTRKGAVEEKEKRQTDSPVKEMKKKMAANAEKEKQATEKTVEKTDKPVEKNDKPAEKTEKVAEKKTDKDKAIDKKTEKDKATEKKAEKAPENKADKVEKKAETATEKKQENKDEKAGKSEKPEHKSAKPKHNGTARVNGDASNGTGEHGTVSEEHGTMSEEDNLDEDEMFPELTYDDTSDPEFEPADALGRSVTRRSQAKVTRTPETPRPASDKQPDRDDDSKVLKLKDDVPSSDRKLRSSDSPKPQEKMPQETTNKTQEEKAQDSAKKSQETKKESPKKSDKDTKEYEPKSQGDKENAEGKVEVEIVVEVEGSEEEPRKTDTNYSKSRVKVSPYRRSMRIADQTTSSVMANYTGNNTTMEMDITETSSFVEEPSSLDDSSYLSGLRAIRGRRSYKLLHELPLRPRPTRPAPVLSEHPSRPTAPVVGRKRKPDADESVEVAAEAGEALGVAHTKRMKLLERIAHPFRRTASSTPLPARRAAEIVGINTDLPLSAPVASADTFDPETLKPAPSPSTSPAAAPASVSLTPTETDRDGKRCIVM